MWGMRDGAPFSESISPDIVKPGTLWHEQMLVLEEIFKISTGALHRESMSSIPA